MKNKVELKKTIIISVIIILVFSSIFAVLNYKQYNTYKKNFNNVIYKIIAKVKDEYPDVSKYEIMEIINSNYNIDNELLREYGIDIDIDDVIIANESYFNKFIICNVVFICIFALVVMTIFLIYNKIKDNKLKEITEYIQEINKRNYKIDISDNTEDELSILKNELYKITIMLREQAQNLLQDKINLKNSLQDISHQLKTPLTSITIMLDDIIDNPQMDNNTKLEFIQDIKREITNINFLVQNILKLSKFDANTIKFINKPIYIKDIINEAIKNVSVMCDLKDIEIVTKGKDNDQIVCDFKWQVEAITNILKNAIEYSESESKVYIEYCKNNVYAFIKIKDSGKGIAKEDIQHIFERFYKGKNSSVDSVGIGLALAKTIIENNNGTISAENNNGETVFTIKYY